MPWVRRYLRTAGVLEIRNVHATIGGESPFELEFKLNKRKMCTFKYLIPLN